MEILKRKRTYTWDDPMIGAKQAKNISGLEYLQAMKDGLLPPPPISHTLEMQLVEFSFGKAIFAFTPQEFHYNPIGYVHGGVFATILDSAMGCALQTTLPAGTMYTTLELKVNFIKSLSFNTGLVTCCGNVINAGKRVALTEATIVDSEGKIYGHATSTCLIFTV